MSIMLRDPVLADPFRLMDQMWGRVFGTSTGTGTGVTGWTPALDLSETDEEYVVQLDLPGVKSEDVSIELLNQVLTIAGTRVFHSVGESRRVERPFGAFTRSLTLPEGVDADAIVAGYADGVLTLHIPKPAGVLPRKIAINGSSQKAISK